MADTSTNVSGRIHVAGDSGSPERVAHDLFRALFTRRKEGEDIKALRVRHLRLYKECLNAVHGYNVNEDNLGD